jgi:hypothetical protein
MQGAVWGEWGVIVATEFTVTATWRRDVEADSRFDAGYRWTRPLRCPVCLSFPQAHARTLQTKRGPKTIGRGKSFLTTHRVLQDITLLEKRPERAAS